MEDEVVRIAAKLEAVFGAIQRERMADVPILNPLLAVAVTGVQRLRADWFAVLVTPWCMNIMLLPDEGAVAESWADWRLGETVRRDLPAGGFGFICGEEPALGRYLMCSLFSPMQEFADQEAALATAGAAARELMTPAVEAAAAPPEAGRSRRAMFGLSGGAKEVLS